jgi:hypothetical protein
VVYGVLLHDLFDCHLIHITQGKSNRCAVCLLVPRDQVVELVTSQTKAWSRFVFVKKLYHVVAHGTKANEANRVGSVG